MNTDSKRILHNPNHITTPARLDITDYHSFEIPAHFNLAWLQALVNTRSCYYNFPQGAGEAGLPVGLWVKPREEAVYAISLTMRIKIETTHPGLISGQSVALESMQLPDEALQYFSKHNEIVEGHPIVYSKWSQVTVAGRELNANATFVLLLSR